MVRLPIAFSSFADFRCIRAIRWQAAEETEIRKLQYQNVTSILDERGSRFEDVSRDELSSDNLLF